MNKKLVAGLLLLNIGVFFTTAAFLPRADVFSYTNMVEQFINARVSWDIAWVATLGSSLLSTGLALMLSKSRHKAGDEMPQQPNK